MRTGLYGLAVALVLAGTAQAATLELRPVGTDDAGVLTLAVGETAAFEIVLTLGDDEMASGAGIYLDGVTTETEQLIELYNFVPGVEEAVTYIRDDYLDEGETLPFAEGAGITINEYRLNFLTEENLEGPQEVVLETLYVRGLEVGTTVVTFELGGGLAPAIYYTLDGTYPEFQLAGLDLDPDMPDMVYLGLGDPRDGGAGSLRIEVTAAGDVGLLPGFRFCGLGALGALLLCFAGLGLMKLHHRR